MDISFLGSLNLAGLIGPSKQNKTTGEPVARLSSDPDAVTFKGGLLSIEVEEASPNATIMAVADMTLEEAEQELAGNTFETLIAAARGSDNPFIIEG